MFGEHISPLDIVPGILGDDWFLSAISILAGEPNLIKRLFITPDYNDTGLYRVKLCYNGRWQEVTVDELIPCYAKGEPAFAHSIDQSLWILILQKAYAKLNGGYH